MKKQVAQDGRPLLGKYEDRHRSAHRIDRRATGRILQREASRSRARPIRKIEAEDEEGPVIEIAGRPAECLHVGRTIGSLDVYFDSYRPLRPTNPLHVLERSVVLRYGIRRVPECKTSG